MKTTLKTLACAAAIAAFAGAPIAIGQQQQRDTRQPQQPDRQQTTDRMQTPARTPDTARAGMFDLKLERASELMGTNVHGANGDKIGDIADFVVSTRTGRIDSVLINTGAILGVGGKEIRVPFHSLNWNPAEERLQTSMTKASIDAIPAFDRRNVNNISLDNLDNDGMNRDTMNRDPMNRDSLNRDPMDRDATNRDDVVDHNRDAVDHNESKQNRDTTRTTQDRRDTTRTTQGATPGSRTQDMNAYGADRGLLLSDIIGQDLNCLAQDCGEVDDAIVELHTGRVLYLVIDPDDNFLGIGDAQRVAPFGIARWDATEDALRIDATKEQLMAAPEFKDDLSTLSNRTRVSEVYRVYGQEAPDLNRRASDRSMNTTTPMRDTTTPGSRNTTGNDRNTTGNDRNTTGARPN